MIQILKQPKIRIQPDRAREVDRIPKQIREAFRGVLTWHKPWPITLLGEAGRGKTSAALCMCDLIRTACYFTHLQLVDAVFEEDKRIWDAISQKQLVVIDDIQPPGNLVEAKALRKALSYREQGRMVGTIVISDGSEHTMSRLPADLQHKLQAGSVIHVR